MTDIAKSIADKDGKVLYKEYIAIRCKDGDVGFYTPTQCDVLADDWEVVRVTNSPLLGDSRERVRKRSLTYWNTVIYN